MKPRCPNESPNHQHHQVPLISGKRGRRPQARRRPAAPDRPAGRARPTAATRRAAPRAPGDARRGPCPRRRRRERSDASPSRPVRRSARPGRGCRAGDSPQTPRERRAAAGPPARRRGRRSGGRGPAATAAGGRPRREHAPAPRRQAGVRVAHERNSSPMTGAERKASFAAAGCLPQRPTRPASEVAAPVQASRQALPAAVRHRRLLGECSASRFAGRASIAAHRPERGDDGLRAEPQRRAAGAANAPPSDSAASRQRRTGQLIRCRGAVRGTPGRSAAAACPRSKPGQSPGRRGRSGTCWPRRPPGVSCPSSGGSGSGGCGSR